jgi:hypothetical protein
MAELEGMELQNAHLDIHKLFAYYNDLYFEGKLGACNVAWSNSRMTSLAAGVCKFSGGGGCEIRLSEPVLKSRTTAELKTTLLHEMIHAYLFSMSGNKDHEYNDFCPSCLLQKQPFWLPCFPVCICLALLSGFLSLTLFSWGRLVMCDSDHGPCFQHLMRSINQCSADDDQVLLTTFMMSGQCLISNKECLSHKQ